MDIVRHKKNLKISEETDQWLKEILSIKSGSLTFFLSCSTGRVISNHNVIFVILVYCNLVSWPFKILDLVQHFGGTM